jgi:hypothetical protein
MMYQKPETNNYNTKPQTNIYKQLQNAIYLTKEDRHIF